ncbi:MAG: cyclic nucleotide-binding domain-containing protein, partial [Chloroflexota bacterium]
MLQRLVNIEPEERRPALILGIYYFLMTGAYVLSAASTSSLFLARVQNSDTIYPLLMAVNSVVTAAMVFLFGRLAKRVPLNALAIGTNIIFASTYLLLIALLQIEPWASAVLFIVTLIQGTIIVFQYYLITPTIFDARQSKRILGIVGIGGSIAGIISGLILAPFIALISSIAGEQYGTEGVVVLVAVLLLIMAAVIRQTQPYMVFGETIDTDEPDAPRPARSITDPYIIAIMVIVGSFILIATTIDIQFQTVGIEAFNNNENAFTRFKGLYTAGTGALQVIIRLFVIGPLLVNFGLIAGLLVLPLTIIGSTIAFLIAPGLTTATLMKGGDQATRFTINETSTELAWVPIPAEQRLAVKPFVSGTFIAIIQGITGVGVYFLKQVGITDVRPLSFIVLGVCALWIPAAIFLQRGYLRKLLEGIRTRSVDFEDLDIDTADSGIVSTIETALRTGTDMERAFILSTIGDDVPLEPLTGVLGEVYHITESIPVRERILTLSADYPDILPDSELMKLIETPSALTDEAMYTAGERGLIGVIPLIVQRLNEPDYEMQAAAARSLVRMGGHELPQGMKTLRSLLQSDDTSANRYALDALLRIDVNRARAVAPPQLLVGLLQKSPAVQIRALRLVGHTAAPLLTNIVAMLENSTTEIEAQRTLQQYPPDEVRALLLATYQNPNTSNLLREAILRTLADYLEPDILPLLIQELDSPVRELYIETVSTLLEYSRQKGLPPDVLATVEGEELELARDMYSLDIALDTVTKEEETLLASAFRFDFDELMPSLLKLSIMDVPNTDIESVIYRLKERDPQIIGNVLEILDNVLSNTERAAVIPLFENRPIDELAEIGRTQFPDLDESLTDELSHYIESGDDWQKAVALDYILRHPGLGLRISHDVGADVRHMILRYNASEDNDTLNTEERRMLSILEKTVLLNNSTLFHTLNPRELYHIAQITEDVELPAGTRLFKQGDPGDTMYIIVRGEVRIMHGATEIATLGEGEAIGEVALLDQKPRTASA